MMTNAYTIAVEKAVEAIRAHRATADWSENCDRSREIAVTAASGCLDIEADIRDAANEALEITA